MHSDQLNATSQQGSTPAELAFLAMAHARLDHAEEAQVYLDRLRETMKANRWAKNQEAQDFLREAETMLQKQTQKANK
jgi:hypothetical protein